MLRKAIALPLLAGLAIPVFADDANVLPQGVLRTTIAPSMTTINSSFDADGERQDIDEISVTTLSLALEYGVTDWLTAGLQWAPGYIVSGSVDGAANERVDLSGANDLFVGAKIQLLGTNGLSRSDSMRFAITPGVKIPTSSYDAQEQRDNLVGGEKDFNVGRTDRGAWGFGARTAFDLLLTDSLYINLFNQTSVFLETNQDYGVNTTTFAPIKDVDVKYGTELVFEAEANYTMHMANGIRTSFGLPVRYTSVGETEVDGTGLDDERWSVSVGPSVSVFFTQWALPMEFQLGYSTVVAGENSRAPNTISLQVKNFLRL